MHTSNTNDTPYYIFVQTVKENNLKKQIEPENDFSLYLDGQAPKL